jgi:hypothetical protein
MSRTWFIPSTGVRGGAPKTQLIGCSLVRNKAAGMFEFYGPEIPTMPPTPPKLEASVPLPVTTPFWFPMFTSTLNGSASRKWYIKVSAVDTGPFSDFCDGRWSNTAPPPVADDTDIEPDAWTTQAGVGVGPEEGEEPMAASASTKQ